jgi:peptidoglycan hydrolase-like protein with peptidoglycan-binding domain
VLELQKFFSDYYAVPPTDIQTGYFGPITQSYVIKFQKEQGLPSYGIVGPMTRAVITRICDEENAPATFTASPMSGTAPLTVSFTGNKLKDPYCYSYLIEFGDGQGDLFPENCEEGLCGPTRDMSHTYITAGTYVAVLREFNDAADCAMGMECGVKLGSVTIVVTGPSASNVR